MCLVCKRQSSMTPLLLLPQTCTGLITSRKMGCYVWQEVLAEGRGSDQVHMAAASPLPLTTLPLCSHKLLLVRIQQQPETKSTFASEKTGQGQPPATPDSNTAHSGKKQIQYSLFQPSLDSPLPWQGSVSRSSPSASS